MSDRPGSIPPQGQGAARLDSFPYRHRVADVMRGPVVTVPPETPLAEASRTMIRERIGSLIVVDAGGVVRGIATERDFLRALAEMRSDAADAPISRIMSSPVATILEDSFLYVAFGRMPRLGVNHLLAVDASGRPAGMVSASALMRLRSTVALVIGDEIAAADGAAALANVWRRIPALVGVLREEGVDGVGMTATISAILRDMTARAVDLAERSMAEAGWGAAPAPWCLFVLGSAGRGESLLGADQDNALIHAGDESADAWFAQLGARIAALLDEAGIPLCDGGVMAANAEWRGSRETWRQRIEQWLTRVKPEDLLNVDIFFDLMPVAGDMDLGHALHADATEAARRALPFLALLAQSIESLAPRIGLFGAPKAVNGRFELKRDGLLPVVVFARMAALRIGSTSRSTPERLRDAVAAGRIAAGDAEALIDTHAHSIGLILRQQVKDLDEGVRPSNLVAVASLTKADRKRLIAGLGRVDDVVNSVRSLMAGR